MSSPQEQILSARVSPDWVDDLEAAAAAADMTLGQYLVNNFLDLLSQGAFLPASWNTDIINSFNVNTQQVVIKIGQLQQSLT